jgi:antitoxin (DNA-binding transcriptional repressor) of toxin-antitoxin stability system
LTPKSCDAKMYHTMKTVTVRDLRYRFSEVEARLQEGEEVEVLRRRRPIARLVPIRPLQEYPDFAAVQREIFGHRKHKMTSGPELAKLNRGDR